MAIALPKRLRLVSPSHHRAKVQEKETAKRIGGKQTLASGSLTEKGDVRVSGVCRIENKTTKHASFSVTTEHIRKLDEAVIGSNEIPIMQIELALGKCSFLVLPDLYLSDVIEALRYYKENNK